MNRALINYFFGIVFLFQSCTKSDNPSSNGGSLNGVYIIIQDEYQTQLWKDGSFTNLAKINDRTIPRWSLDTSYEVNSMVVNSDTVYIVGDTYKWRPTQSGAILDYKTINDSGVIWKNGVMTKMLGIPMKISFQNNDLFLYGFLDGKLTVWKNGIPVTKTAIASNYVDAMFGVGNDIYSTNRYVYRKNSDSIYLKGDGFSRTTSIYVNGTDIYVGGWESIMEGSGYISIPAYWKNGVCTMIRDSLNLMPNYDRINGYSYVFGTGNDVCVAALSTIRYIQPQYPWTENYYGYNKFYKNFNLIYKEDYYSNSVSTHPPNKGILYNDFTISNNDVYTVFTTFSNDPYSTLSVSYSKNFTQYSVTNNQFGYPKLIYVK